MKQDHSLTHDKIQSILISLGIKQPSTEIIDKISGAVSEYHETAETNRYLSKEAINKLKSVVKSGNQYRSLLHDTIKDQELTALLWNTQMMQDTEERINRIIEDIRWIGIMLTFKPEKKPRELRRTLFVANMIPIYKAATGKDAVRPHIERFEGVLFLEGDFYCFVKDFLTHLDPGIKDTTIEAAITRVSKLTKAPERISVPVKTYHFKTAKEVSEVIHKGKTAKKNHLKKA